MPESERFPILDRTSTRAQMQARLDAEARRLGFTSYNDQLDADYQQWQARAGILDDDDREDG